MKYLTCSVAACMLVQSACQSPRVQMTQLQIRQIQTRFYEIKNTKRAMKAILNVLQDEGFMPKEVDVDVGFAYAVKEMDVEDAGERFWAKFWHGREDAKWRKSSIIECAANVTELRDGMRVRLSFRVKILDNKGQVLSLETIDDPRFYQDFFSRVDKSVFIEKEGV